MYEDEKQNQSDLSNRSENYTGGSLGGYNSYGSSYSNYGTGAGNNTSTYGSSATNGTTSTYGSGATNSTAQGYGANTGNNQAAGYGAYANGQNNTYGYSNPSYTYNRDNTHTYGTYQYSTQGVAQEANKNEKKPNVFARVIAAVAIVALIVGGIGASYYVVSNQSSKHLLSDNTYQEKEEEAEEIANEAEEVKESVAEEKTKVQTTTVSSESKAVVTDVTAVVEEAMPAMVIIHNNYTQSATFFGYKQTQEATASGSGIIVGQNDSELIIATNYHVIEGADTLEVIFNDDTTVEAFVKGTNSDMDLAVIAVKQDEISSDTINSIKIATLGDSDKLVLGEPAIAIGNALGYGQSVTTGVISALNREVELDDGSSRAFIQTDAAINPGNSGGALLNLKGEVIGINSNKLGGTAVEGMGYAIPISEARPIIDQLMTEETKVKYSDEERGYIGISGVSVTSDVSEIYGLPLGVYVAEAANGGGAAAAGIEKGDVIVAFEGQEITSMDDLTNKLQYYPAGDTVEIVVMRSNGAEYEEQTFNVVLGNSSILGSGADSNAGGSGDSYEGSHQKSGKGGN